MTAPNRRSFAQNMPKFRHSISTIINKIAKKYANINNNISYCPERIVQSKALIELSKLPQIVSGVTKNSIHKSVKLFKNITLLSFF